MSRRTANTNDEDEDDDDTYRIPVSLNEFANTQSKPYDNDNDDQGNNVKRKTKLLVLIIFNLIIISILAIIRFAHPDKPKFTLQDATVFVFNLSTVPPNFLNSSLQITLSSRNPNQISGIDYSDLGIFAEYRNQQITYQTTIPPAYQDHHESNVWSLFINGVSIPIAPDNVPVLTRDQSYGVINLDVKINGHIRWKIGSFTTRKYPIHVICNAFMDFGGKFSNDNGDFVFSSVKYRLYRRCSVIV